MCRNIRPLFNFAPPATDAEIRDAALQFVRKIAGTRIPAKDNERAFEDAVSGIFRVSRKLIDGLVAHGPPRDREVEAAKARERAKKRFGKV